MTLIEILVVVSIAALVLSVAAMVSIPTLSRESMRGAAYDVYTHFQLARTEAVSRNVDCRFVIDTSLREMEVVDTKGTPSASDDEVLHRATLNSAVKFSRPDSGSAVTLPSVSGTIYQAIFTSDGTVSSATGQVHLFGGNEYRRVELLGAGGVEILRWNGSSWVSGG
jgi:Tfp pilus assembly protein FimT